MSAVVTIHDLWKCFTLYHQRPHTMKEMLVKGWGSSETFWALRAINLEIEPGESVGIVGGNGSGKSTLLKLVAGILQADRGRIGVHGRVSALLELGAGFHPDFTGRENVFLNGIMLGLSRREITARFDDIVTFAEMERFIDTPVKHYSSGMYMRLAFSVAVNVSPDILLIDEVLAVGDSTFQRRCLEQIERFKRAGTTLIFVSHDRTIVQRVCDRIVWLKDGELLRDGDAQSVLPAYEAAMLGEGAGAATAPEGRCGTKEVEIAGLAWLDGAGQEQRTFRAGEPVTLQIAYQAHRPVDDAVVSIGLWREDGTLCLGTTTQLDGYELPRLAGAGMVRLQFDRLDLLSGIYALDVTIQHRDETIYDSQQRCSRIRIQSEAQGSGIYSPPHRWAVSAERSEEPV